MVVNGWTWWEMVTAGCTVKGRHSGFADRFYVGSYGKNKIP